MTYRREMRPGDWELDLGVLPANGSRARVQLRLPGEWPESLVRAIDDAVLRWHAQEFSERGETHL